MEQAGFVVGYDKDTKISSIVNKPKELKLIVDGKGTSVKAVNINGNNYTQIRSLATATGAFEVLDHNKIYESEIVVVAFLDGTEIEWV